MFPSIFGIITDSSFAPSFVPLEILVTLEFLNILSTREEKTVKIEYEYPP